MKKIIAIVVLVLLFLAAARLSFYFEDNYRKIIQYLYSWMSDNKITFNHPLKYFHFASRLFVLSFGLFVALFLLFFFKQTRKQKLVNGLWSLLLFASSTLLYCYFDGYIKLLACTACDDGTRVLNYDDIHYDPVFVISLTVSILPFLITELKKIRLSFKSKTINPKSS